MKKLILMTTIGSLAWVVLGCQAPSFQTTVDKPVVMVSQADASQAWDDILDVLRQQDFTPDQQNYRAKRITTEPALSAQWFEFWRADAQGTAQGFESSLHSIRRWVEVKLVPADGDYRVEVKVHVQRRSQPERQVTTASNALQIYGQNIPLATGERAPAEQGVHWVELGDDPLLERYLLERIARRLPEPGAGLGPEGTEGTAAPRGQG